jgi:hypothetical protein
LAPDLELMKLKMDEIDLFSNLKTPTIDPNDEIGDFPD